MMKKQLVMIILSIVLAIGSTGIAFADTAVTTSAGVSFLDMPDNWSTAALNKAVSNQLLKGYAEGGGMLIKADNPLTRAEMAAVVNRAFASEAVADISKVTDVASFAWYAKDIAKAVKMGTFALDTVIRPDDKITRQEAFAVLARAFKLTGTDTNYKALDKFSDKSDIAAWALKDLDGLAAAGYIQGSDGKLNPKANITRAEFAVVMDNLVKQYIDEAATLSEVTASGNVMIRVPGVTLKNVTVKGDLIIADGVGKGNATLDNVKVEGRTVVRGGGENSIIIKGNSDLGKVIVSKVDGKVRISVEGNADVEIIYVDDGSDDVFVEGTFGTVEVAGDNVTVFATKATLTSGVVSGDNSKIIVGSGSTIKDGVVSGKSSGITVNEGATVDKVTITGSNAKIEGDGTVKNTEVKSGGDNASITTPNTVISVGAGVSGTTAAGGASVPAGSTATNNATGTGSQVTDLPQSPGGGGGTPALSISVATVSGPDGAINPVGTLYQIPKTANKNNTGIAVNIKNTKDVDHSISIDIKNGNNVVAHAEATGIEKKYLDLLDVFGEVTFGDIGDLFDHLGTGRSGWYKNDRGAKVDLGTDETAFTGAIDTLFVRMGDGDIYTVTVKLTPTGGNAAETTFTIQRR
jgi:carbonic anhydrase/acetyltransferase-like protein (isoleucine patch superfamily)